MTEEGRWGGESTPFSLLRSIRPHNEGAFLEGEPHALHLPHSPPPPSLFPGSGIFPRRGCSPTLKANFSEVLRSYEDQILFEIVDLSHSRWRLCCRAESVGERR